MCIEQYANSINKKSDEAYSLLLKNKIIDELNDDYEDLHGMSFQYINKNIDELLGDVI